MIQKLIKFLKDQLNDDLVIEPIYTNYYIEDLTN